MHAVQKHAYTEKNEHPSAPPRPLQIPHARVYKCRRGHTRSPPCTSTLCAHSVHVRAGASEGISRLLAPPRAQLVLTLPLCGHRGTVHQPQGWTTRLGGRDWGGEQPPGLSQNPPWRGVCLPFGHFRMNPACSMTFNSFINICRGCSLRLRTMLRRCGGGKPRYLS
jgi:hypothetical protein